jgi:hypothetical protein
MRRILVLLTVAALMVVMLAFGVATAAIAQGRGVEQREKAACGNAPFEHVPLDALPICERTT